MELEKKMEHNPIQECNMIQKRFCAELFSWFANAKNLRHQSYVDYSIKTMLGMMHYKCIGGIENMQEMSRKLNDDIICHNLYHFRGRKRKNLCLMELRKTNFCPALIQKI